MTCIVGLKHKDKLYMGADSLGANTWQCYEYDAPKVFHNGPVLVGYTSSFRMGQILQHGFDPPEVDWENIEKYMAVDFSNAIRKAFKDSGWLLKEDERESGGTYLVGIGTRLFKAQDEFSFVEPSCGYIAVGSGGEVAMGSLYSTAESDLDPEQRVLMALGAAQKFTPFVREPFVVEIQDEPTFTAQTRLIANPSGDGE